MNRRLIINTVTAWDEPPRARHQFTFAIAKQYPVIFIARNKTGWFNIKRTEPQKNITLIEPIYPIDYRLRYRLPIINECYQIWLYSRLKRLFPDYLVINFDFTAIKLSDYYSNTIYYCNDEYIGNSKYTIRLIDYYIAYCERKVAQCSKFCITTAKYLTRKLSKYNENTYEIPLGATFQDSAFKPTINLSKKNKIVVGLMGVINERHVSVEAVNKISSDDQLDLVLIGPVENSFRKKLRNLNRVKLTGILKGESLIQELNKLDVGVALYNMKCVNQGVTPNKMWQYLSLGKPVVVSDLQNLKDTKFPEKMVYRINNEELVNDIIKKAHTENTLNLARKRIEFAKQNSWDHRIADFLKICERYDL